MVFKDIAKVMIQGEARPITPGKLLIQIESPSPIPFSARPDFAFVVLGDDQKCLSADAWAGSIRKATSDRAVRLLFEAVRDGMWSASVFEVSTILLPVEAMAVTVLMDRPGPPGYPLTVTLEDGRSNPHLFPTEDSPAARSALMFTVYRRADGWKARAVGQHFQFPAKALADSLGVKGWPSIPAAGPAAHPERREPAPRPEIAPPQPSLPSPGLQPKGQPPLDLARLSALERDTAAVSALLSDIFSDAGTTSNPSTKPITVSLETGNLDAPHLALLSSMMSAKEVTSAAFDRMAQQHGLMPSGAVETINDWSFDLVGDIAIIDIGEEMSFNEDMRKAIEHHLP